MREKKTEGIEADILEKAQLCAEQGWKGNYHFKDGEIFSQAFITKIDVDNGFVMLERIGERDLKPRLVDLRDVKKLEPDWS